MSNVIKRADVEEKRDREQTSCGRKEKSGSKKCRNKTAKKKRLDITSRGLKGATGDHLWPSVSGASRWVGS